tara:strand:+ start:490 stop:1041 length:552 start_codon:yes stop_codon:yes gene_type:complete
MFIKSYKIKSKTCDNLIKCFYENKNFHAEGTIGFFGVDKKRKDSTDLEIINISNDINVINYLKDLDKCVQEYKKTFEFCDKDQTSWSIIESPIIQKYNPKGGFKIWHYENNGNPNSIRRHLVFMTFLNDVKEGGETEFFYQKKKFKPKKGLTLIWPAIWTHTHKGIVSTKYKKYIITGWISYK